MKHLEVQKSTREKNIQPYPPQLVLAINNYHSLSSYYDQGACEAL